MDPATMNAASRFDETMREMVHMRFKEFDAQLGPKLLREFIAELVGRLQKAGRLSKAVTDADMDRLDGAIRRGVRPDPRRRSQARRTSTA